MPRSPCPKPDAHRGETVPAVAPVQLASSVAGCARRSRRADARARCRAVRVDVVQAILEPQVVDGLQDDRGKGLVDLDDVDLVERQPGLASAFRTASGLPWSMSTGSTPDTANDTKRARGRSPSRSGAPGRGDQHRRGAVADLAGVAGGDDAVRLEGRRERGEALGRGVPPGRLVDGERRRRLRSSTGTISLRSARRRSPRLPAGGSGASRRRAARARAPSALRSARPRGPAARSWRCMSCALSRPRRRPSPSPRATCSRRRPRRRRPSCRR